MTYKQIVLLYSLALFAHLNINANVTHLQTIAQSYEQLDPLENALKLAQKLTNNDPNYNNISHYIVQNLYLLNFGILAPNERKEARPFFEKLFNEKKISEFDMNIIDFNLELDEQVMSRWTNNPLPLNCKNKRILITNGWGFGDHIMHIRYALCLKKAGAYVIAQVKSPLVALFSECDYLDMIISTEDKKPQVDIVIDYHLLMKLTYPIIKKIIPNYQPYIKADKNLTLDWEKKLEPDRNFKVGICWQSSGACYLDQKIHSIRNIPLKSFEPLSKLKNISFYSLQQVTGLDQLQTIPPTFKIHTFDETFDKTHGAFMDTAAVMENLDLIISVDTSIPQLAGALGRPVWTLIPYSADWRWPVTRPHDTPWYPTMRLFKQTKVGQWDDVIEKIVEELKIYSDQKKQA